MKLTIFKEEFLLGLSRAHNVADKRSSMPVLANVLLETEGPAGLRISATDLHLGVTGIAAAEVERGGATTVSARTLFDIVRALPSGTLSLWVDDSQWLHLEMGRLSYRIAGIPAADFPELPSSDEVSFFAVDSALLSEMIEQTYFAISTDEARPQLNGALFEGKEDTLVMVATDGHRLSLVRKKVDGGEFDFSMLLPLKAVLELRRLLDEGAGDVEIGVSGPNAFFRRSLAGASDGVETEVTMSAKLVDAQFPPYDKVIPKEGERRATTDRKLLLEALRRTAIITRDKAPAVLLTYRPESIILTSDNPDVGEAKEEIDAEYDGSESTMGFNGRYLIEALEALKTVDVEKITLEMNGPTEACVIKSPEYEGYLGVVMPMRI